MVIIISLHTIGNTLLRGEMRIIFLKRLLAMCFFQNVRSNNGDETFYQRNKIEDLDKSGDVWERNITVSAFHVIYLFTNE